MKTITNLTADAEKKLNESKSVEHAVEVAMDVLKGELNALSSLEVKLAFAKALNKRILDAIEPK